MNFAIIKRTLGWILIFEALFFVLPIITGLIYQETQTWAFVWTVLICLGVGSLLVIGKVKNPALYAKEGFVIVAGHTATTASGVCFFARRMILRHFLSLTAVTEQVLMM